LTVFPERSNPANPANLDTYQTSRTFRKRGIVELELP
jgi:hypothetical protein